MNIWIMRHGEASFNAPSDPARQLTMTGASNAQSQGKWLGEQFKHRKIQLDKILVSPYLRAKQTLESLIDGIQAVHFHQNFANLIEEWDEITPEGDPETVESYLHFLKDEGAKHILIVSHLPLVFDLARQLTHHQASPTFPTATIVEITWLSEIGKLVEIKHP